MSIHDTNLHRAGLPSVETLTRRILRTFDRATASDVEAGATWYDEAHDLAVSLSVGNLDVERTASVIAALSPRTTWTRNVRGATLLIEEGEVLPGLIGRNVETADRALVHGFKALTGPKTSAFARNIAGDVEAVTVDVWAARVVQVDPETQLGRKGVYDAVAHAYRLAARRRGVAPATMQATTWIVARGGRAA
jgi:hypothetical protein